VNGNRSGRTAEDAIADLLSRQGCEFTRQALVGTSIYGYSLRADFVVHNLTEYPSGLVIESKWQDTAGTADEKFPYLVANIMGGNYGRPVIVVVSGGGCRPGALNWLQEQVSAHPFVAVFSLEELMSWLQRDAHVRVTSPRFDWTRPSSRA
jgi:hypothetical protein